MPEKELPWAGPPKSHLRWPAMLFGVFGVSVGLLIVAIGFFAILDYSSENTKVEIESPSRLHPSETFTNSSEGDALLERIRVGRETPPAAEAAASLQPAEPVGASSGSATAEAIAHAKSRQRTFVAQAKEVSRLLDECDQEQKAWTERVLPLMENELGRRIAGDASLVRQFRNAFNQDRPSAELAGDLRTSLNDLIAPIKAALDDPQDARLPRAEITEELKRFQADVRDLRDALRGPRQRIDALVSAAKSRSPQDIPLRQALEDLLNAEMLAETQKIDSEVVEANRVATEQKAKAAAKLVDDQAKEAIAKQQAEAEHVRLVAKAKTREVQQYLRPFISKGYMQYRGGFVRDAVEGPMSYKGILDSGALNQTTIGLTRLNTLAADPRGLAIGNDRPGVWNYVGYPEGWSKSDQDHMRKVQDLLRELGPTLVELKMLAP